MTIYIKIFMNTKKITINELKSHIKNIIEEHYNKNEAYKWKPSASQRKEFAERMKNPDEKLKYEKDKEEKANKRREKSKFDYNTAGGEYIPTKIQYDFVMKNSNLFNTSEEKDAMNKVIYGYTTKEKVHHDNIHIVNDKIRSYNN